MLRYVSASASRVVLENGNAGETAIKVVDGAVERPARCVPSCTIRAVSALQIAALVIMMGSGLPGPLPPSEARNTRDISVVVGAGTCAAAAGAGDPELSAVANASGDGDDGGDGGGLKYPSTASVTRCKS